MRGSMRGMSSTEEEPLPTKNRLIHQSIPPSPGCVRRTVPWEPGTDATVPHASKHPVRTIVYGQIHGVKLHGQRDTAFIDYLKFTQAISGLLRVSRFSEAKMDPNVD